MNFSAAAIRRVVSTALVVAALGAQLIAPAAEAAPPPPPGPTIRPPICFICLQFKPDLYLATMYQRDVNGNSINGALAGQTVMYPITIGNKGMGGATGVTMLAVVRRVAASGKGIQS